MALDDGPAAVAAVKDAVALAELSRDLQEQEVLHALLMDNGGDVALHRPVENRFEVHPAEIDRAERWPLSACLIYHEARS